MSYLFDTHVHTNAVSACGKTDAKDVVRLYKKAGYDGIVITEHLIGYILKNFNRPTWEETIDRYLIGYDSALEEAEKVGLKVLLGMEIRFDDHPNDYLVYGITRELLKSYPKLFSLTLPQFYQFAKESELLIYQAHPFRAAITPASPEFLDGIEVYNGNPRHNSYNDKALAYADKYGLRCISGSDFHQTEDLGRGGIYLKSCPNDSCELVSLLNNDGMISLKTTE